MPDLFRRYATPFITGLFVVSLVSGVALFFHVGGAAFHGMHEWLSMVLIVPFALHLWRNWRAMMNYVGRVPFTLAMVVSLAAALGFAYPSLSGSASASGGPPQFALADALVHHGPKEAAPVLGLTAEDLVSGLQKLGFAAAALDLPLNEAATKSGKTSMDLMAALKGLKK
ncbi:DUF4405 domain-containing protein [Aestuariivirga sp.]|uniref:DUF4405 domain-containing protein n=1 Tax=Aestuariivirga sp. TaxID=2650926 RepID=UPI0035941C9D